MSRRGHGLWCTGHPRASGRGGFTLIEIAISTLVVALMLVAALTAVGAVARDYSTVREFQMGHLLGEDLMAEILGQRYVDAGDPNGFGVEAGESTTARADFDDVDDYDGWSDSPPVLRDGTVVPGAAGWSRSVSVKWVDPLAPDTDMASETGVKRIEVAVTSPLGKAFTVKALRSAAGAVELQPPVDHTYVTGIQAELQVGTQDAADVEGASIVNHAEDQ